MVSRFALLIALIGMIAPAVAEKPPSELPQAHVVRQIEGWNVRVDRRLLEEENSELADEALQLLEDRLRDIVRRLADEKLADLRRVVIQLDLTHGGLTSMQYHPGAGWLVRNGYAKELEKCVHIPSAKRFVSAGHQQVQPWSTLHELAHAYHDQFLNFDNEDIIAVYNEYKASGAGDKVLHINGYDTDHYALTNHKEFFAEFTESYVGRNDFYPFNRGELKKEFLPIHQFMKRTWGPMP